VSTSASVNAVVAGLKWFKRELSDFFKPLTFTFVDSSRNPIDLQSAITRVYQNTLINGARHEIQSYKAHFSFVRDIWERISLEIAKKEEPLTEDEKAAICKFVAIVKCLPLINIQKVSPTFERIRLEFQNKIGDIVQMFEQEFIQATLEKWSSNVFFYQYKDLYLASNRAIELHMKIYNQDCVWETKRQNIGQMIENAKHLENRRKEEYDTVILETRKGMKVQEYNATANTYYADLDLYNSLEVVVLNQDMIATYLNFEQEPDDMKDDFDTVLDKVQVKVKVE